MPYPSTPVLTSTLCCSISVHCGREFSVAHAKLIWLQLYPSLNLGATVGSVTPRTQQQRNMIMSLILIRTKLKFNLRPKSLALAIELLSRKHQTPIHLLIALEVRLQCVDQMVELSGGDGAAFVGGLPGCDSAIGVCGCGEGGGGREVGALGRE
jgi:hypothetical protein